MYIQIDQMDTFKREINPPLQKMKKKNLIMGGLLSFFLCVFSPKMIFPKISKLP